MDKSLIIKKGSSCGITTFRLLMAIDELYKNNRAILDEIYRGENLESHGKIRRHVEC